MAKKPMEQWTAADYERMGADLSTGGTEGKGELFDKLREWRNAPTDTPTAGLTDKPVAPEIQAALEAGYALGREAEAESRDTGADSGEQRRFTLWLSKRDPGYFTCLPPHGYPEAWERVEVVEAVSDPECETCDDKRYVIRGDSLDAPKQPCPDCSGRSAPTDETGTDEITRLRFLADWIERDRRESDKVLTYAAQLRTVAARLSSVPTPTGERDCPNCEGDGMLWKPEGNVPCPDCHGTGRSSGVDAKAVRRVAEELREMSGRPDAPMWAVRSRLAEVASVLDSALAGGEKE